MKSKLLTLAGLLLICVFTGCTRRRPPSSSSDGAPSHFDQPAENFIYRGMIRADLLDLMGEPENIKTQGDREIWYYDFGVVVLVDNRVKYRYPPLPDSGNTEAPRRQDKPHQY